MISIPEYRFNRPQRTRKPVILHERLVRLNKELMQERTKSFDDLYAIRQGLRIHCCVMRDEDNKFFAAAKVANKAFRVQGGSPSGAFIMLTIVLNIHLVTLPSVEREKILNNSQVAMAA